MNLPEGDLVVLRASQIAAHVGIGAVRDRGHSACGGNTQLELLQPSPTGLNRCDFTKMLPPKAVLDLVLGMPTLRNRV